MGKIGKNFHLKIYSVIEMFAKLSFRFILTQKITNYLKYKNFREP